MKIKNKATAKKSKLALTIFSTFVFHKLYIETQKSLSYQFPLENISKYFSFDFYGKNDKKDVSYKRLKSRNIFTICNLINVLEPLLIFYGTILKESLIYLTYLISCHGDDHLNLVRRAGRVTGHRTPVSCKQSIIIGCSYRDWEFGSTFLTTTKIRIMNGYNCFF